MSNAALQLHDLFSATGPTGLMSTVPPEIFRRRMTARLLEDAEEAILKLEQALLADNAGAAAAARYHIAAVVMQTLHDDELKQQYLQRRNESIVAAQSIEPMRHRQKRKKGDTGNGKK